MLLTHEDVHHPAGDHELEIVQGTTIEHERSSFRDPNGFVFLWRSRLYRQVNPRHRAAFDRFVESGLAADLIARQWLVPHEEVPHRQPGAYKIIKPERIPFISYPYEWSFSQLKDAALLTLRLQQRALEAGMTLKDATAYNVQFLRGRPIFIDTLSFDLYQEGRPWDAYRQFCQHFLAPLALMAYDDTRLNRLSRIFIDGVPLDIASRLLPWTTRLKPSLAIHIHAHARAQSRHADRAESPSRHRLSKRALQGLIEHLASTIRSLTWTPAGTEWADYYDHTNYSTDALGEKERLVETLIDTVQPQTVWDLGANTGRFSRIAAIRGIRTIAFDVDPAATEKHYLQVKAHGDEHVLPLVLDLGNPSPSLGWAHAERSSIAERGPADLVMALALIHHLAIGNNVPFAKVAEFMASLGEHLVIEFVPKADSQVQKLLASREDIFDQYTQADFEEQFRRRFVIEQTLPIPGTARVLYHMRRRM